MLGGKCGGSAIEAGFGVGDQLDRLTLHERLETALGGEAFGKAGSGVKVQTKVLSFSTNDPASGAALETNANNRAMMRVDMVLIQTPC